MLRDAARRGDAVDGAIHSHQDLPHLALLLRRIGGGMAQRPIETSHLEGERPHRGLEPGLLDVLEAGRIGVLAQARPGIAAGQQGEGEQEERLAHVSYAAREAMLEWAPAALTQSTEHGAVRSVRSATLPNGT